MKALQHLCQEFNHTDICKHNAELHYGAVSILAKKLSMTDNPDEIRYICNAIEMVFRADTKFVQEVFYINGPTLMPLLLRLLDRYEQSQQMKYADEVILSITKTLYYISRINELRVTMARQQGLLDLLQRVATSPLNVSCRIVRIRIIANLANCEENKSLMFAHQGLLTAILNVARLDISETAKEFAAAALMDLASASTNQTPLSKNAKVLRVLTQIITEEKSSTTRECAITTIQNLAFPKSNRLRLVEFEDGAVLKALLNALVHDPNMKGRRRAGGALTNLACPETAERMANYPGLLQTLAIVSTNDENSEVQMRSCLALTKIASNVSLKSPNHGLLLDALVTASTTSCNNNISAVLRCKAREPEYRETLAKHQGLLWTLSEICTRPDSSLKDRDNATRAIMHLANENVNRKIMCHEKILDALVIGASGNPTESKTNRHLVVEIQESAIRAIARLATEISNRQTMARHAGLLVTVAKATERETKILDKGIKLEQQSFLGRALLMSLLMAL